ncbi:MAG TPA: glycoside hydrolase family 125 protein [Cytophagaceae bacterium]|jgi:hypothetical protein
MNRRNFIAKTALSTIAVSAIGSKSWAAEAFTSMRPPVAKRKFVSKAVETTISNVKKKIADKELAWMFENCYPNTLDTTVNFYETGGKPQTYVITGDIDAMWLRDSSAQVWPYLPLCKQDKELQRLIAGVVNKQAEFVLIDPYANSFYDDKTKKGWNDETETKPGVHERKWEVDSLCYVIRLAHGYWKATGDTLLFDADWNRAMKAIVSTFKEQQRKENSGPYRFRRSASNPTDSQFGFGYGNPTKKVGLIHSMFRPSDDATFYPFLISSNMFAVVSLRQLAEMYTSILKDTGFAKTCIDLAIEVDAALGLHAAGVHPFAGKIYALEADGFGNHLFMDDANIPNLLSLPYLGYCKMDDPLYVATRKFSLSANNPWFNEGKFAKGIGGPHVGVGKIWPLGMVMQILTTSDEEEIKYCLKTLKATHAGTGFIHESFNVDDPKDFSREWFAWANTLFGEMIVHLSQTKPHLLALQY